jgi:hypothetical protein
MIPAERRANHRVVDNRIRLDFAPGPRKPSSKFLTGKGPFTKTYCKRKRRLEHRIEITAVKHKYAAAYQGERIGEFRVPECDAARWLLANGRATRDDRLIVCRNGRPAMRGSIGWLAARTVIENEKESPRWAKYRPFSMAPSDRPATPCGSAQEPHHAAA